jgi:long-chain acyl-CoA synthetase
LDTLVDLFSKAAREHGPRECVWMERSEGLDAWSYQELWRRANAVAFQLHRGGVGPGERVLVYAPNSPRLVATYFGLLLLGAVIVPIDLRSSPEFMVAVREKARAHTLISAADPPAELASTHALRLAALNEDPDVDIGDWRPSPPGPDDLAEVVFTSGTTGRPKGVMLTHRNIASNAESAASVLADLANFRALSLIPLSHMFEQIALFAGMLLGANFTYVETLAPNTLFDTLRRRGVTMIPTVPQIIQIFYRAIEAEVRRQGRTRVWNVAHSLARRSPMPVRRRLFSQVHERLGGRLEYFFCGGAYLPPELQQAWERLGVKVLQGYGTTECSPVVTANVPERRVVGSVGRPIPGVSIKLSEEGEILVRGENVTPGYFEDPAATSAAFDEGWYKTKDLGELDKDGNLYIRGRKDDMIVLPDGQNLYPEDIENALRRQPAIRDAVVFGLPKPRGLLIHAVLVPEPHESGIDVTAEELAGAVRDANRRLANYQRIDSHAVWAGDDFPRTHTLKVKRQEVLKAIEG